MAEKSKPTSEEKPQEVELKFVPTKDPKLGRIYSAYISVSHSPWDFTMRFCEVPARGDMNIKPGDVKKGVAEVPAPSLVDVTIPAPVMPSLIAAMQAQLDKYRVEFEPKNEDTKTH